MLNGPKTNPVARIGTISEAAGTGKRPVRWRAPSAKHKVPSEWSVSLPSLPEFRDRPGVVSRFRSYVLRHPSLKRGEKLVALQLLDCLSLRRWQCAPSRDELAKRCGVTVRTISRALAVLRQLGLWRWLRRRRRPSLYLPNLALIDTRYSAPSGAAVNDQPYGFGDRRAWLLPVLRTAAGAVAAGLFPGPEPEVPRLSPLSAAALASCARWK